MEPGHIIAQRYRLGRKLGEGGMGTVYAAEHVVTGRHMAVKVLEKRDTLPPEAVDRFLREARAPAAIRHPNVVEVFDAGTEPDGTPFIAMELLEGETLDDVIKRDRVIQPAVLAEIMDQLLAGLDAMHTRGFVHRDLKPANIFLVRQGSEPMRVKLLDFGIAKALGEESRTRSGYVIGTPAYMAPEQMRNARNAIAQSDLWSIGVMLYEALVGHRPFRGETFGLLAMIAGPGGHKSIARVAPELPIALADVVDGLLAKDYTERPATAADVRAELIPLLEACPPVHAIEPTDDDGFQPGGLGEQRTERGAARPSWREQTANPMPGESTRATGPGSVPIERRKPKSSDSRLAAAAGVLALLAVIGGIVAIRLRNAGDATAQTRRVRTAPVDALVESDPALSGFLNRWIGTVSGSQGQAPVTAFYADSVRFRGSVGLATPTNIQRYWARLFGDGGSFAIDWSRSTWREEPLDLNSGVSAACINLVGATGRLVTVRGMATERIQDRSAEIGCPRLEGVYFVRMRRVGSGFRICHETWSLRDGICASCPTAPACQNGGAQRP